MNRRSTPVYIISALVAFSGLPKASAEQAPDAIPENLRACLEEEDDTLRLACYDREVPRLAPMSVAEQMSPEEQEESFGKPPLEAYRKDELREITATVRKLRKSGDKVTVWLDNEQVWQQKYSSPFLIKEGDEVTIEKKSLMGGHRLKVRGRHIEVKRVD